MLKVASGLPSDFAFKDMELNSIPSLLNQREMIRDISTGPSLKAPTPFSRTNETFPSSWHGINPVSHDTSELG